jgi:hypothetical protein
VVLARLKGVKLGVADGEVGVAPGVVVEVGGTAVPGRGVLEAGGAYVVVGVPAPMPPLAEVAPGVVAVGATVVGVVVVAVDPVLPWTRADAGTGKVGIDVRGVDDVREVVLPADPLMACALAGASAAIAPASASAHAYAECRSVNTPPC